MHAINEATPVEVVRYVHEIMTLVEILCEEEPERVRMLKGVENAALPTLLLGDGHPEPSEDGSED
jgi:hypothetical protein